MASIRKRQRKNGVSYLVEIRTKGHPPVTATFHRLTDAKKFVQDTESAIREGRYFKTREAQKHTLGELIEIYVRDVLPEKRDGKKSQAQLEWWNDQLGSYTLADITAGRINGCKVDLLAGTTYRGTQRTPATVNRYLAALSACLNYAVKDLGWLEDNPARKVRKGKESRGRVRFLSDDERNLLLDNCGKSERPYIELVVMLALSTGMRQSEIMNLTWGDVDTKQGRITLHETKNNEVRLVAVAGPALVMLKEHAKVRPIDTDLVFPGRNRKRPVDIRPAWLEVVKGIDDFHFHDLRHSAASYLAMNGASLAEIAAVLGHKTLAMVKRYSHLSEAHTADVVTRMNERIFGGEK